MVEHHPPAQHTITLARFIEQATFICGGIEPLRRRLGISQASIEAMSVSEAPMLDDDAAALLEAFGLSSAVVDTSS